MNAERQAEAKRFIEDVGICFEEMSLPRMAGRILGQLFISDPPHQSIDELAEALMASKGSISTTTRLLIQFNLIERFSLPGIRHDFFRIRPAGWYHLAKQRGDQIKVMRQLCERALELLEGKAKGNRKWLEEMRDMYAFFEREFPALVERWEQEHKAGELKVR
ncbi:MAG: GbsR/MarR family transcriptional regulator [Dehalococcoidales bacterium]